MKKSFLVSIVDILLIAVIIGAAVHVHKAQAYDLMCRFTQAESEFKDGMKHVYFDLVDCKQIEEENNNKGKVLIIPLDQNKG